MNRYISSFLIALSGLFLLVSTAVAEQWLYDTQYVSGGLGYESKMPDEDKYEGAKLLLEGRYVLRTEEHEVDQKRLCCEIPALPTEYRGVLDAALRYGFDSNELEYIGLGITPWAKMWDPGQKSEEKWQARRDLLEIGPTRYVSDDALEVDSYLELGFFRAGRAGEYKPSPQSNWTFDLGAQGAVGYAWAQSSNKAYSKASNAYAGIYLDAAVDHARFGSIYFTGRFVNGFTLSNPSRGHPTAREALVRNGYIKSFSNNLKLDIFWEKRSFYFDEGGLPNLYTWVRTYGGQLTWHF
jgi:hypothetical protein